MIGTNFGIYRPNQSAGNTHSSSNHVSNNVNVNSTEGRPQGAQLSDFMQQLEDYVPTVPDAVTAHFLNSAGFETSDPRIVRLISVATQKFISDVANDALQHCKARTQSQSVGTATNNTLGNNPTTSTAPGASKVQKSAKDRKYTLTVDDLSPALADYGITVRKAQYFT